MATYKVGNRVRIKIDLSEQADTSSLMVDRYAGQVMTIKEVKEGSYPYRMVEDSGSWHWSDEMIFAKVCEDETPDCSGSSFAELFGLE